MYAEVDISAQLAQLKGAKKSEKYIIMNKIKIQIAKLNSTQRAKAISQLRRATSNTGSSIQVPQTVLPLTTHIQELPQIPVLPAPQTPASSVPQLPGPSVPQIPVPGLPGPSVPQIPVPQLPGPSVPQIPVPQLPGPSVPQVPVPQVPGDIPNQTPSVTIPLSTQHIPKGGQ